MPPSQALQLYRESDRASSNSAEVFVNARNMCNDLDWQSLNPGARANDDGPVVYRALAEHQASEVWRHRKLVSQLLHWAAVFNREFKLDLHEVALRIDPLPVNRLGQFRYGHNGHGLRGEVTLNERYLAALEMWLILGVLLHELLHAWQQEHGTPGARNRHNEEFCRKAAECGLFVDENGRTRFDGHGQFAVLLRSHEVVMPDNPPEFRRAKGHSKLGKWSCGCQTVRVGTSEFHAQCLKCQNVFKRTP